MAHDTISLRRRHLILAGIAGAAAPAGVFAAQCTGTLGTAPAGTALNAAGSAGGRGIVVSGRIVGPGGHPLAAAAVEAWQDGLSGQLAGTTTDADGRFMFMTRACAADGDCPQSIRYRVSHPGHATREMRQDFARSQLQRDETGMWRATVGLALA